MHRALLLALLAGAGKPTPPASDEASTARFDAFVLAWREGSFAFDPGFATEVGVHRFDKLLPRRDRPALAAEIARCRAALAELRELARGPLPADARLDLRALEGAIEDERIDLEDWKIWEKSPQRYLGAAMQAVGDVIRRDFAPREERMAAATERLLQLPALLQSARANVSRVPEPFLAEAKDELEPSLTMLRENVPAAFAEVDDPRLRGPFGQALDGAIAAVKAYGQWLEGLPTTPGGFALGPALFQRKLKAEELVELSPDRLLAIGRAELARLRRLAEATAKRLDPKATPEATLAALLADRPAPEAVLKEVEGRLEQVRTFVTEKGLVTIPSERRVRVVETPPWLRGSSTASMEMPGPLETVATESFFEVTLPDPKLPRAAQEAAVLSRLVLSNLAVHEAYPGHFVHYLHAPRWRPARALLPGAGFPEGWAHYSEELVVDAGFGGDRERLGMLSAAMVRAARMVAAVGLHAKGWTVAQARKVFEEEALAPPSLAQGEATRGAGDPMYLAYTLGKLQLEKLRKDLEKKRGKAFDRRAFHDELLSAGPLPVVLQRERLGLDARSLPEE